MPQAMIGRPVEWSADALHTPGKTCALSGATIRKEANRKLEDSIWGGQKISGLALSRHEAEKAFGPTETPVFEDHAGCVYAISIDHDRVVITFPSGYIYLLSRSTQQHTSAARQSLAPRPAAYQAGP
jgi:hypothetical protein